MGGECACDPYDCVMEIGDDFEERHVLDGELEMAGGVPGGEVDFAWHDGDDVSGPELAEEGWVCGRV